LREILFIVNPTSHNLPKRSTLLAINAWLHQQGWQAAWEETQRPGQAIGMAARAAEARLPLIFVVGGDGTLNEAANGLVGSETALAMVPAGTVNVWARDVGIPLNSQKAVQACLEGERRLVDLGRAGDRYFLLMAGYGLDGYIAHNVSMRAKRYLGATSYAAVALREALRYRGDTVKLFLDEELQEVSALMVLAGNTRNYAGLVEITGEAKADDGLLDVCAFLGKGTVDIFMQALGVILKRHRRSEKVIYRKVRRLELAWEKPLRLQIDGDAYPHSPSRVEVVPSALTVMVPKGIKRPLFSH